MWERHDEAVGEWLRKQRRPEASLWSESLTCKLGGGGKQIHTWPTWSMYSSFDHAQVLLKHTARHKRRGTNGSKKEFDDGGETELRGDRTTATQRTPMISSSESVFRRADSPRAGRAVTTAG